ncbi:MAG: GGDEF domain-containing protein, partial [Treponema sp.]|nr:GGDEF domain-containing protein [Treponema sp.]
ILNATLTVILYYFYKRTSENSFTDYLTGLGNRRSYVRHIHEHLSQSKPFYVTCIEIQDFKHINNTFGIQEGDSIIRQISARMKEMLTPDDTLFIITGATFAVISRNIASSQEAQEKFEQIIKPMSLHLSAKNYDTQDENSMCTVSLSAGMVYIDSPKTIKKTATAIFKDAETAMLVTQKNDNRKVCIYDSTMEDAEE